MRVLQAYKPFDIHEVRLSEWKRRPVKNNFFELVMIKEGEGTQCIDYNVHDYAAGSLFLLPPLKCHAFQIARPTVFVFIKFTSDFFRVNEQDGIDQQKWFKDAAYILSNYNQLPGDIIHDDLDRRHIYALIDLILKENEQPETNSLTLIKSLMTGILEVILRNVKKSSAYPVGDGSESDQRMNQLLAYINENITRPELLKVDALAKTFCLSPNYLGEFFRKNAQLSLREYIVKTKLKLVEIRLLNSEYRS